MPGNPAARLKDMHTCPQATVTPGSCFGTNSVPHVGGPIVAVGSPTVNINGIPAARVGDNATCQAPMPMDMISTGATTVIINGRFAAVVTSRTVHTGTVTKGSPTVNIGGPVGPATFGNAAAGTKACRAAAATRKNGEQQGFANNCGNEAVRTACIEKCGGCAPPVGTDPSCSACDMTEAQWYAKYFAPDDQGGMVSAHNAVNQTYNNNIASQNDAAWAQVQAAAKVTDSSGEVPVKGQSWSKYQGQTLRIYPTQDDFDHPPGKSSTVTIQSQTAQLTPPFDQTIQQGLTGTYPETRQKMLADWCGIHGTTTPANTMENITDGLANGKMVIASVDVGTLNPGAGSGQHAITVTQMTFNPDGSLATINYTDTSQKNGCDRSLSGANAATLQKALTPGAQLNVI